MSPDTQVRRLAEEALTAPQFRWRHLRPFLGPAFLASVAYMDPGNFATNISGGAQYGYALLWVILAANLSAMFIQYLSAKIGIVTGKSLPQLIGERLSTPGRFFYWLQAEVMAMATDVAEFLGASLAFQLLLGVPLIVGAVLTGVTTYALLALQRLGFRPLESAVTALVGVITLSYVVELFLSHPQASLWGGFVPSFRDTGMLYLSVGIFGATVMPHVIYMHSALTQDRILTHSPKQKKRLLGFTKIEILIALGLAGIINLAMLTAAAGAFYHTGIANVGDLSVAYKTLTPLFGPLAAGAFAIALLASGLSSSTVGTLAGQIVMQGFVRFTIPLWLRRLVTMLPTFLVIWAGADVTQSLVLSQVILSFGIPLALVPLLLFGANRTIMGAWTSRRHIIVSGWVITGVIVALNVFLIIQTFATGLGT